MSDESVPATDFGAPDEVKMKSEVIKEVHALVHERLFGVGAWLREREIIGALNKKIDGMGLTEPVPGKPDTTRSTALGREINIHLEGA